jgi:hypothetical protein
VTASDRGSILSMNASAYRLLGFAVWRGGKWYLRKRLPPARSIVLSAVGALAALVAALAIGRRVAAG